MKKFMRLFIAALAIVLVASAMSAAASAESYDVVIESERVIFIKDLPEGYSGRGLGNSAEDPFIPIEDPEGFDPTAEYPRYHYTTAFYQATDLLKEEGGTIVVCGEILFDIEDSSGRDSTYRDVFSAAYKKPIKITSVYNGVDYRETAGAKIILKTPAELTLLGPTVLENIDIVSDGTKRVISFNNKSSIVGEGVNCYPADDGYEGVGEYYVSLASGHRYNSYKGDNLENHLIVRSGTYNKICGGSWGAVSTSWADMNGDEEAQKKFYAYAQNEVTSNLTIEGETTVLGEIVGTNAFQTPFGGNVNITINGGTFECDINGGGISSFINEDAVINIKITDGDFEALYTLNAMTPNFRGSEAAAATVDLREFKGTYASLTAIVEAVTDIDESRIMLPDYWHGPDSTPTETKAPAETTAPANETEAAKETEAPADDTEAEDVETTVGADETAAPAPTDEGGSNTVLIIAIVAVVAVAAGLGGGLAIAKKGKSGKTEDKTENKSDM